MTHCPDFSDSDSYLSDDGDYHNFKERTRCYGNRLQEDLKPHVLSEEEKLEEQKKLLYTALCSGNILAAVEYIDNGLSINIKLQDGWTPLLLAACVGNSELSQELIKRGADVNSSREGYTALMMACNCPKQTSDFEESLKVIKLLVENGANVRVVNRKRMTALMLAANTGNLGAVKYLLPLSNKNAEDNQRWTALFWAVNANEVEVVKYLLQEGFEYGTGDVRNDTPLDIAKNNDFYEIIDLFPQEESDVISNVIDAHSFSFEETFARLKPGEKPTFFLDICNILCGVKSESVIKIMADQNISLIEFLSITNDDLERIGINLPYQRNRILGGIYKFHKYPFHPNSLHVIPLKEPYSNIDVAIQILSCIKQLIAMEASLSYILKNSVNDITESEGLALVKKVADIRHKIKACRLISNKVLKKTEKWDRELRPADLITTESNQYQMPWRKIIFTISIVSLVYVFKVWK